jgi:hypothetical protein
MMNDMPTNRYEVIEWNYRHDDIDGEGDEFLQALLELV